MYKYIGYWLCGMHRRDSDSSYLTGLGDAVGLHETGNYFDTGFVRARLQNAHE